MEYNKYTVKNLKKLLAERGLPTIGRKEVLIARLNRSVGNKHTDDRDENNSDVTENEASSSATASIIVEHSEGKKENNTYIMELLVRENKILKKEKELIEMELEMKRKHDNLSHENETRNGKNKQVLNTIEGKQQTSMNNLDPLVPPYIPKGSFNVPQQTYGLHEECIKMSVSQLREFIYLYDGKIPLIPWITHIMAVKAEYNVSDTIMKLVIIGRLTENALAWFYS